MNIGDIILNEQVLFGPIDNRIYQLLKIFALWVIDSKYCILAGTDLFYYANKQNVFVCLDVFAILCNLY